MKNKATALLKKITSVLGAIAKAKTMAVVKTKFNATKARIIMLSLLKNKKVLMESLSHKIHRALHSHQHEEEEEEENDKNDKAIVLYSSNYSGVLLQMQTHVEYLEDDDDDDDKYPDLRHSLFEEEEEDDDDDDYDIDDEKLEAAGGSIIDMMRNSKEEGEEFKLEEEIDEAADLFIKRFRKQIRLQKLDSFKRLQDMLARGI